MNEVEKRTKSIRVRLAELQLRRLEALARRMGIPAATIAALGVCRFLDEEWHRMETLDLLNDQGQFLRDDGGSVLYGTNGEPVTRGADLGGLPEIL